MGRSIFIGDVHGCSVELHVLLDRVGFVKDKDRLIFVGDLVARGPDSRGVLQIARENNAIVVRGNHEERILRWRHAMQARTRGEFPVVPALGRLHAEVAYSLQPEDWDFLEKTEIYHHFEDHRLIVVHAGLVPGVALEAQNPTVMMHIRSITEYGEAREEGGSIPWGSRWLGPPHVVFGHSASLEPQIHPWATGVDTACVYGGYLTAVILEEGQEPPPIACRHDVLVSVPARQRYFEGHFSSYSRPVPTHTVGPGLHAARRRSHEPALHTSRAAVPSRRAARRRTSG